MTLLQKIPDASDLFKGLEEDYPDDRARLSAVVYILHWAGLLDRVREELIMLNSLGGDDQ